MKERSRRIVEHLLETLKMRNKGYSVYVIRGYQVTQQKPMTTVDSLAITDGTFSHTFSLVKLKSSSNPLIVFINQYYIMNGENYEVSLYEKK